MQAGVNEVEGVEHGTHMHTPTHPPSPPVLNTWNVFTMGTPAGSAPKERLVRHWRACGQAKNVGYNSGV